MKEERRGKKEEGRKRKNGVSISSFDLFPLSSFLLLPSLLLSIFLFAPNANAAIAFVQSEGLDSGTVASDVLAFGSNNTAGNTIIVAVRQGATTNPLGRVTITDSNGNTYLKVAEQESSGDHKDYIFVAHNIVAGANTVTCTFPNINTMRWAIHEYSGLQIIGAVDQTAGTNDTSATPDSGNIVTTQADVLLFGMASVNGNETFTAGGSYTEREEVATKMATEDRIVSSTGTYSAGFSLSGSDTWAALVVAFKQSDGLVGWWRLDDGSGTNAVDSSGYGNTGTTTVNPVWTTGKRGGAIDLDGAAEYIDLGSPAALNIQGEASISVWAKFDDVVDGAFGQSIFSECNAGGFETFSMKIGQTDNAVNFIWNDTTAVVSTATLQIGQWYHLVAVRSGSTGNWTATIYVNGSQNVSAVVAFNPTAQTAATIGRCGASSSQYFNGILDDVRIYNRALSASEIQAMYAGGRTGNGVVQNGKMNL